jgi:hypothetical protein
MCKCGRAIPCFGYDGEKATCCKDCKEDNMINVKDRKCTNLECKTRASYGKVGDKVSRCAVHVEEGMITKPRRRCEYPECKEIAICGTSKPERCDTHRLPNDLDYVLKKCISCNLLEKLNDDMKCSNCNTENFHRVRLRKQRQVKFWIDSCEELRRYEYYDQIVDSKCGKERPDFMWDCVTHKVILEVDEYQHNDRQEECECTRMVNVTHSLGMPCIWIRYNPDDYKGMTGGIRDLTRKDILLRCLKRCMSIEMMPKTAEEFCRVVQLFFDGFKIGRQLEFVNVKVD